MLRHLGVSHVRLMTNDESEAQRMRCCGVEAEVVGWGDGSSYGASDAGLLQQQQQQLQAMLGHLSNSTSSSSSTAANNGAVGAGL
jgi:hypothetical protein